MERVFLDFEKPLIELEKKVEELKLIADEGNISVSEEVKNLEKKIDSLRENIYGKLTPWQRIQLARHPIRPYFLDYVKYMTSDFFEIHGDGCFADDPAMVCGIARIEKLSCILIGQQKGRTTKEKLKRNFGMAHPEGYRKALRVMRMGAKFGKPIITLVDTPGAYPGIGAEERGQAQAIATNIKEMSILPVPIIVIIIGEGGSGGALGIGVGDRVFMLEYSYYSVISPEGCASILWRDAAKAPEAARALKITATDLMKFGIIDGIIEEPPGGAHQDYKLATAILKRKILSTIEELSEIPIEQLVKKRINKFLRMGVYA